jgi:hypothetical protein
MAAPDWTPSVADVGAILRARTKDTNGSELGTFSSNTRPTAEGVQQLVATALSDVLVRTGPIPSALEDYARRVVALGGALLVELSYFPEQIQTGRSPYAQLRVWYDSALERLGLAVDDVNNGGEVGGDEDELAQLLPLFSFPDPYLAGWNSRW